MQKSAKTCITESMQVALGLCTLDVPICVVYVISKPCECVQKRLSWGYMYVQLF